MQNHPEGVAIIVCNNDDMAMAAARAAKGNAAYAKTIFVGFDGIQSACNAILAGEETMSVAQEAYDMGYKAVEAAVKAVNGETLAPVGADNKRNLCAHDQCGQLQTCRCSRTDRRLHRRCGHAAHSPCRGP